jgi:hypothetical protein
MNICKNVCETLTTKSYTSGYHLLGKGWKKCRGCCVSIETDEMKCPCCKRKLSIRKRHNYARRKIRA